jgi:hypothetical protein
MHVIPASTRLLALAWIGVLACGPGAGDGSEAADAPPIAGMYEVSGSTIAIGSGEKRTISGKIILAEEDGEYTATFNLTTMFPVGGEAFPAEVIGKGEGTIQGRELTGTAETQLVIATVPGVDTAFAYVPRTVTTRLESTSKTTIAADGTVAIQIENQPAEGEDYQPTRTTLRGHRVSTAGVGGPDAGAEVD